MSLVHTLPRRRAPLLSLALLCLPATAQERPDPARLVEQARQLLPSYEGDEKASLAADEERDVRAASHLFEASLALAPDNAYGLWWLGHASALLSQNARTRGDEATAARHDARALAALGRAIELEPQYEWALYARAMARRRAGDLYGAIGDFDEAVRVATAKIDAFTAAQNGADEPAPVRDARFVRFKARQWRADTRMSVLEFDVARDEFRSFYADNGNNQWDLAYSLAETYLRQRDFAAAREVYEGVLAQEEFQRYESTYTQLGYLAGLVGDTDEALRRLNEALEREFEPGVYLRIWTYLLAEQHERGAEATPRTEAAAADLRGFLEHPPANLSAWDRDLGRFVVGLMDHATFAARLVEEKERRLGAGEALDDLDCEGAYYQGWRFAHDARSLATAERAPHLAQALDAFRRALSFRPRNFKWEWAYARLAFADVATRLGARPPASATAGLQEASYHRPGWDRTRAVAADELLPGDLVLGIARREGGAKDVRTIVVDAVGTGR